MPSRSAEFTGFEHAHDHTYLRGRPSPEVRKPTLRACQLKRIGTLIEDRGIHQAITPAGWCAQREKLSPH